MKFPTSRIEPLTAEAFAPFGAVIEAKGDPSFMINDGAVGRFHALAKVEVAAPGKPAISVFRAKRQNWPVQLTVMERHPLGSQAFMPLEARDWLVVVADTSDAPTAEQLRVFHARGDQGVQYARGVWHHPLVILAAQQDFLIVDRVIEGGDDPLNLEEVILPDGGLVIDMNSAKL